MVLVYPIVHGLIEKSYQVEYEGEVVITPDFVKTFMRNVKHKFNLPGKLFLLKVGDSVVFVTKVKKNWKYFMIGEIFNVEQD